jgi:hypothetical protein
VVRSALGSIARGPIDVRIDRDSSDALNFFENIFEGPRRSDRDLLRPRMNSTSTAPDAIQRVLRDADQSAREAESGAKADDCA